MSSINTDQLHEINIFNLLDSPFAVSTEEGEMLFALIDENFIKQEMVILDFQSVDIIVSTFLNASIGQLYGKYTTEFIQDHLSIKNMANDDLEVLKLVTDRAKEYFKDRDRLDNISKEFFSNGEE